jgi:anti-sigma factor RsiW
MSETAHQAMQELLPWFAAGTLGVAEARQVQAHLHACAACRQELAWHKRLLETDSPLPAGLDAERALARLMPQLDARATPAPARTLWQRLRSRLDGTRWQGWAIGAQLAVIALLVAQLLPQQQGGASYHALGRGAAVTPDLLVVFRADARLQDLRQLLQSHGAQIVGGPTVTGSYLLDVAPERQAALLAALRADPAVELAEPMTAGVRP